MSYQGNLPHLLADIKAVTERFRTSAATLTVLRQEYRVGHGALRRELTARLGKAGYEAAVLKTKQAVHNAGQFNKGCEPYRHPPGTYLSPSTEFKKGHRPATYKAIGAMTHRKDKCGKWSQWIKVKDEGPLWRRSVPYARHVWEEQHGQLPAGKFVIHLDGDTLNDSLDNLEAVSRSDHLKIQMARSPEMRAKRSKNASAAAKKRHAAYREQHSTLKDRRGVDRAIKNEQVKKEKGCRRPTGYECLGCGATSLIHVSPCVKCMSTAFERVA